MEKLSVARTGRRVCRVSLWLTFLLVRVLTVDAQRADLPFSPGEELRYGAYYNWQFLWVNAGEVVFQTDTVRQNGQTEWLLEATGATYKAYDLFYTVRDTFRTLLTYPDFQPLHFYRAVNHGGHQSWQSYAFDRTARKISYVTRAKKSDPRQRELPLSTDVHDLLSQAYLFRKYNFDGLKKDEMIRFSMMTDEKPADFYFRYKGKEVVKTRNGRRFNCHKVSVWLMEGEFFPEGEDMLVWFTADKNHIPVMVETKIQIGAVKAIFLDANSLTYPLNSEIN
ncbi:DUF3108 domain-containing protein [Mangrovibacterium marinum]|uniref:Uncharacterized protein DUF3108 n=1 Tax=Mangrovibacterium marinum TaxID=1639118 RepID=A0A2T5C2U6_9BACT|nr:DUF3108 domain-containing protein [Mangrovibacterium marinum]PTN09046.1 uncharacterized protein DUF3108 [Mangrovibacterium marinum]